MIPGLSLHHFRFHLEPKAPLHMPAYNKGNVIRGGFGSTFRRIVCQETGIRRWARGNSMRSRRRSARRDKGAGLVLEFSEKQ